MVLIAVLIMGTMAAVAVPKFTSALATANTTKIQSDLAAIDTSIALYNIDKGSWPSKMSDLASYLDNYEKVTPPTGKCNINGNVENVPGSVYEIKLKDGAMRAFLGEHTIYDFGGKGSASSSSSPVSGGGSEG